MSEKQLLKWYQEMGCDTFLAEKPYGKTQKEEQNKDTMNTKIDTPIPNSRKLANNAKTLDELKSIVENFKECDISKTAINTVFADGNQNADIMLIGEAPGAREDEEGIPFCGQSGKLLDNILPSIALKRGEVYITNTVFWRPPGNRRPTRDEIVTCRPFVEKHIALLKPKLIVLVGNTAVESLLEKNESMHNLRQQVFTYSNQYLTDPIKSIVIFHPSYLLRQPVKKKLMWADMLKIKKILITV